MKIDLFKIGSLTVHGYGFMIGVGFILAMLLAEYRAKKLGLREESVIDITIIAGLSGFLGAKLLYVIVEFDAFVKNPKAVLGSAGFVVYGGIIAGVLCCMLYCKIKKLNFLEYFDLVMPEIALAQGFGRIGCLLAGCCYGKETSGAFSITFHTSAFAPNGVALVPTQIYSSILDFLHYGLLLLILRSQKKDGETAAAYLIFYSAGRFVLEFFRGDLARGSVGVLSTSQFISVFTFFAGIVLLVQRKRALERV